MTGLSLGELIGYSDYERGKWRAWIAANPRRMDIPFHAGGRFATVGALLDHIFLVERRHLSRLEGGTPPEETGVPAGDVRALFEYADLVRADLRRYAAELDANEGATELNVVTRAGTQSVTKRWLAAHILLHEIRHLAQIAYAARTAGDEPPGEHDIFYYPERS
jgi:uncharacterized damage-inducible protein DinB